MTDARETPEAFVRETIAAFYAGADLVEWAGHGQFPFHFLTPRLQMTIPDAEAFVHRLRLLRSGFVRRGIARVESEIRWVRHPDGDNATVAMTNTRIGPDGKRLGSHMALYVLRFADGGWRYRAISMHDAEHEAAVRARIERMHGDADGTGTRPGGGRRRA